MTISYRLVGTVFIVKFETLKPFFSRLSTLLCLLRCISIKGWRKSKENHPDNFNVRPDERCYFEFCWLLHLLMQTIQPLSHTLDVWKKIWWNCTIIRKKSIRRSWDLPKSYMALFPAMKIHHRVKLTRKLQIFLAYARSSSWNKRTILNVLTSTFRYGLGIRHVGCQAVFVFMLK